MNRDRLTFARGVVTVAAIMLVILTAGTLADWIVYGLPLARMTTLDYTEARFLADMTNRGLNQLLALTFTVVAIAVPLTANLYSLKFLDFFIKDSVNAAVLTLVVYSDLASFWTVYSLRENSIPFSLLYLGLGLLLLCLCVLFPYLHYVFRFLHPTTLLTRLEAEIGAGLRAAARRPARAAAQRQLVAEGIEHIANIAIRSIERTDRATAIESVVTLERVARAYWSLKPSLPPGWFVADPNSFRGFSSQAVDEFSASRIWVEMKVFSQLRGILSSAVPRTHDVADTAAKALRRLGLAARADPAVRELVTEYFNTFIRLALTRHDTNTAFALFDHYRLFAEEMNRECPDLVLEIAFYFEYYGQLARENQLPFVVEAGAHDLATLTRHAWETQASNRQKLLQRFLHYEEKDRPPLAGVKKAQAILASYFLACGQSEPAQLIRGCFMGLDPRFIGEIKDDLLHVRREKYWEISERRMNFDYVPPAQREKLREFFDSLITTPTP